MIVIVRMIMVVRMAMAVMVRMTMLVGVRVVMLMIIVVMVQSLARTRTTRVFVKHQRLDRHRHRVGRHADPTQVDIVEVPQHHAIDDQQLAVDLQLFAQDVAERLRHVAVSMMKTGSFLAMRSAMPPLMPLAKANNRSCAGIPVQRSASAISRSLSCRSNAVM